MTGRAGRSTRPAGAHLARSLAPWTVALAVLAATGRRGRRALLRAALAAGIAGGTRAAAAAPLRRWARRAGGGGSGSTGAGPSPADTLAFAAAAGAAIESPAPGAPLAVLAGVGAWRRARSSSSGGSSPAAVAAGAALGVAVAAATRRAWPVPPAGAAGVAPAGAGTPPGDDEAGDGGEVPLGPGGEGLVVVVNPDAGHALSEDAAAVVREGLPGAEVVEVAAAEELRPALEDAARRARVLGVCGGDGSVNAAVAAALAAGRPLLVVPGGTLNHLARDLGIETASSGVDAALHGRVAAIDVGVVDGRPFVNTAALGAYPELVDIRARLEPRIGKWPAMLVALAKVLRSAEPTEVDLDGARRSVWMVFVGNCRYLPSGFAVSWRPRLDDGVLDVRLVDASWRWSRLRVVGAVLLGRLGRCRAYEQRDTSSLRVRCPAGALRLARDGETFDGAGEFSFAKSPERLSVVVPTGVSARRHLVAGA